MNGELNKRIVGLYQDMIAQLDRIERLEREQQKRASSKFLVVSDKSNSNRRREQTVSELEEELKTVCQRFLGYVRAELTIVQARQVLALLPGFHRRWAHITLGTFSYLLYDDFRDQFLHWERTLVLEPLENEIRQRESAWVTAKLALVHKGMAKDVVEHTVWPFLHP